MNCITSLKTNCPSNLHANIEVTLINFDGAREELGELCRDDALYEGKILSFFLMHVSMLF
jgi:hypothetical protein